MKRTGSCRQCGSCCRDFCIDLHLGGVTDYEFTEYLRWLEAHVGVRASIKDFRKRYVELQIMNQCKYLVENTDGTFSCAIHENKPEVCKQYPEEDYSDEVSKKCGYKFSP
jgi:Fe-S-cluster containining protein